MTDGYGRNIDYLRISLTDKCNLRCVYCMPPQGINHISHDEILTFEEITRIVKVMAELGIKKIRLTGGEPLVRKGMLNLVKKLHEIKGIEQFALTTNGILLSEYARELKEAGITRINVSLDTLNETTFQKITGCTGINTVLKGIHSALDEGFRVKLNCVPCAGLNDNELEDIAKLAQSLPLDVRFIEMMPIGCGKNFTAIPSEQILLQLEKSFGNAEKYPDNLHTPAQYYRFQNFKGKIGFISPLSHSFCQNCNRIRLTTEGILKLCLCYSDGLNLKKILRSGADESTLKNEIIQAVKSKPEKHTFNKNENTDNKKDTHTMAQIGG